MSELIKLIKGDYMVPDILKVPYLDYKQHTKDLYGDSYGCDLQDSYYKVIHTSVFSDYYEMSRRNARFRIILGLLLLTIVLLSCLPLGYIIATSMPGVLDKRTGTISGDSVIYFEGTKKIISINELGIYPDEVSQGEHITLYFDKGGVITAITENQRTSTNKKIASILLLIIVSPIIVVVILHGGSMRFNLGALANCTYKYTTENGKIKMDKLCFPCGKKGEDARNIGSVYLEKILRYKSYKNKFTCIHCLLYDPIKKKSYREKVWILNTEPMYQTILKIKR